MKKKILLCSLFFSLTPLLLFFSVYLIGFFDFMAEGKVLGKSTDSPLSLSHVLAPSSEDDGVIVSQVQAADAWPIIIENYLKYYQSPLLPFKDKIIEICRQYNVKPQLIVAIAQQESNLGKKSPPDCYNAWGWGINESGTRCFQNWEEAIETVVRGIAKGYCEKGYCTDPCLMMKKYTPKSNGSWCAGVNQFLQEMDEGNF